MFRTSSGPLFNGYQDHVNGYFRHPMATPPLQTVYSAAQPPRAGNIEHNSNWTIMERTQGMERAGRPRGPSEAGKRFDGYQQTSVKNILKVLASPVFLEGRASQTTASPAPKKFLKLKDLRVMNRRASNAR